MTLHRLLASLVLSVLCWAPLVAAADQREDNRIKCNPLMDHQYSYEEQIRACTWLIEFGDLGKGLSSAAQVAERYAGVYATRARIYVKWAKSQQKSGKRDQAMANYDRAIADYTTVITRYPLPVGVPAYKTTQMLLERGNVHARKGDDGRAIADYSAGIERLKPAEPGGDRLLLRRAETYRKQGNYSRAIVDLETSLRFRDSARNVAELAWTRYLAGQHRQAVQDAQRVLEAVRDPQRPRERTLVYAYKRAAETLGHALVALGDKDQSMLQFERAMLVGRDKEIKRYQQALAGHGYKVESSGRYDLATYQALKACVQAGCRLVE